MHMSAGRRFSLLAAVMALAGLSAAACGLAGAGGSGAPGPAGTAGAGSAPALAGPIQLSQFATASQVSAAVRAGTSASALTPGEASQLQALSGGGGIGADLGASCPSTATGQASVSVADCTFGDTTSRKTIVLVGDSRAAMWFDVLDKIAIAEGVKLIAMGKNGCPAAMGTFRVVSPGGIPSDSSWPACTGFHHFEIATIRKIAPRVVIDSSTDNLYLMDAPGAFASPAQVQTAFAAFLREIPAPTKAVVLGNFPNPGTGPGSPDLCLSRNPSNVGDCEFTVTPAQQSYNLAQERAATQAGARFIDQNPWFCASKCPAVIARFVPYTVDGNHVQSQYAAYLTGVLWAALKPYLSG